MAHRGLSQEALASELGTAQSAVSEWLRGRKPNPERVYQLEKYFDLPPGSLARLLNYLPPTERGVETDVDAALILDNTLNEEQKQIIQAQIRSFRDLNRLRAQIESQGASTRAPAPRKRKGEGPRRAQ
jgi:transcriptional regulator with XRE-family HTH domain